MTTVRLLSSSVREPQQNGEFFHISFTIHQHVTYSVHIQGVHSEVIRVQVKGLEELLHSDLSPFKVVHDAVGVHAVRLLDEAQQVLLVHAGGGVDVGVHLE